MQQIKNHATVSSRVCVHAKARLGLSALVRLVVMPSGLHGVALAPLVARGRCCLWWLFSCGAFLGAFLPCLVFGGVFGRVLAFRGFFRACRVRGACLRFAFRVAFGSLAPVLALFRLVFAFGVFSIGQKEKVLKIGFKMARYVFALRDAWQALKRQKKNGKLHGLPNVLKWYFFGVFLSPPCARVTYGN